MIQGPVHTVVGGFHLLDGQKTEEELAALAQRLKAQYPETLFYTSHCTGDKVFAMLKAVMSEQIHAFSCGMTITCNEFKNKNKRTTVNLTQEKQTDTKD